MMISRTKHSSQRGVAAVEFGLILPVLMLILLGIIDYGHVFFVRLTMTNAAREGARVGITHQADDAQTEAEGAAQRYLDSGNIQGTSVVATTPSDASPDVTVTVTVDPYTPLIGLVPTPDSMQVSSTMRWELATPGN